MKRFKIEGFSKYEFGLDGSVFNVKLKKNICGGLCKGYIQFGLYNDDNIKKSLRKHQIVYKLFNQDYELFRGMKLVVDHINGDITDNHISNLQLITQRDNCSKEKTIKSGLPVGVCYDKKTEKYKSYIKVNNDKKYLGCYETITEASLIYQKTLKQHLSL
jgi:hypothetical protein